MTRRANSWAVAAIDRKGHPSPVRAEGKINMAFNEMPTRQSSPLPGLQ